MKLPIRTNPKTPEGWPKRIAISVLCGLAVFLIALPISFLLFLNHDQHASPSDPQNLLSALTAAVVLSLALAAFGGAAMLTIFFLLSLRTSRAHIITADPSIESQ